MHCVIPWSDGIEGLVMCAVSCGDRIKRIKNIVGIYMTSITKMHGTMNIKLYDFYSTFATSKQIISAILMASRRGFHFLSIPHIV